MARQRVTDRQYRQMLAARQRRGARGQFLPLSPEQRMGGRASTPTPPVVSMAIPTGPTVTPQAVEQEVSGFRKALTQTMKDMGGEKSQIQDALLDGLRKTAEEIVQQNKEIFGDKFEKTVDQSAAYEIFEKVVQLSEQAASAKTVEQKRKILQRLQTFKRVAQNVFAGGGKQAEIAAKLIEIIEKIEQPLSEETGIRAATKEKITDVMRQLPEKMAAKIPLVGGILSRSLQRRRERKEEEADALASITEEISRAGRTSLYGRRGGMGEGIGPTPTEPPIPGGTPVSELGMGAGVGLGRNATSTLGAILLNVQDIKKILLESYDPEDEELREEESRRENENQQSRMLDRLKGLFGGRGRTPAAGAAAGEGGGIIKSILEFFGLGKLANILGSVGSTIGGIATTLGSMISGLAGTLGTIAMTVGRLAIGAAGTIGSAAAAAAPWIGAAAAGAGIGTGAAYLVNKSIDKIFGTDLAERQFQEETYTFSDVTRDRERETVGNEIVAEHERQTSTKEFIESAAQDPRMLPKLVSDNKLTGTEALSALKKFEEQHGSGEDTQSIRQRIMDIDPSAIEESANSTEGILVPSEKTSTDTIHTPQETVDRYAVSEKQVSENIVTPSQKTSEVSEQISKQGQETQTVVPGAVVSAQTAGVVPGAVVSAQTAGVVPGAMVSAQTAGVVPGAMVSAQTAETPKKINVPVQNIKTLPMMVSDGKMTRWEALSSITKYEENHGSSQETESIRQRIIELEVGSESDVKGSIVPPQKAVVEKDMTAVAQQNPSVLPDLVGKKKMGVEGALSILQNYESRYGVSENTEAIRKKIIETEFESLPIQGKIVPDSGKNMTQQTLNILEQSQDALAAETSVTPTQIGGNTVVAPTTNNSNTTINNNSGNLGVRNNEPTLKAAERASL